MVSLTIPVSDELKGGIMEFSWVNWSETAREELIDEQQRHEAIEKMLRQLESKEERDFEAWAVKKGREINEESWKRVLSTLSPQEKKTLLG